MKKIAFSIVLAFVAATAFTQTPTITSFSPASGPVGTLVSITGTNLSNPTMFKIGGVSAIVVSDNGTTLVGLVMPGAATGAVSVTTAGGTAPGGDSYTVAPTPYPATQQGSKLVGSGAINGTNGAAQGSSVSLSADGNTALVGGPSDNSNLGAAWVYTRSGTIWTQQGSKLVGTGAINGTNGAAQGSSVSLSADGNTAIVGGTDDSNGTGAAWVYTRSGTIWTQQGNKLVGTGASGNAAQGNSVSLSADGNTAIVGGTFDNSYAGAAWVYTRSGTIWTQQGSKLVGTGAFNGTNGAAQGSSVSLSADGNTAIVGGRDDSNGAGAAWVYTRSGTTWTQQGSKLMGTGAIGTAWQGSSVSLSADGNTALVGGPGDNSNLGAAWVYTRSGTTWTQQGNKLVGTGAVNTGLVYQGVSVSLSADGNTAIVGGNDDNSNVGAAWVYTRSGTTWAQQGNKLVGTGASGHAAQGQSVSLSTDGNTAIVGGTFDNSYAGAAWVYISCAVARASQSTTTCSGVTFSYTPMGSIPTGTTYAWAAPTGVGFISGGGANSGSILSDKLTNTTASAVTATYSVTPSPCGSPFTVTVTVNATRSSTSVTTICSNQTPYSWNGQSLTTTGTYYDTLSNMFSCDSFLTLQLTVNPTSSSTSVTTICSNQTPYSWNGLTFTTAGSQTAYLNNSLGCDSAATLVLTVKQTSSSTTRDTICSTSFPYLWNGLTFNSASTQTAHLTNSLGCDSAATLLLIVNPMSTSIIYDTISLDLLPYVWNGLTFTGAGTQTAHLINSLGCDSAATLNLTIGPTGISELSFPSVISLYPNPNKGSFTLKTSNSIGSYYTISDMLGHIIAQQSIKTDSQVIELPETAEGIYTLSVKGTQSIRFVIMR